MNLKQIKHELQNVLQGTSGSSHDALIQTAASYIGRDAIAGNLVKGKFKDKAEETEKLIAFANKHNLFLTDLEEDKFISEGAEQRVFIESDKRVLKINDGIYYESWLDYFFNLLLHNYFFADTSYDLIGFYQNEHAFYAVVEQVYVKADLATNLEEVKTFLTLNGFQNNRNHDYYHPDLGIILEDLHDENVLTKSGVLYFIDTVFFIKKEAFWSE
jgi:hypothetical protein